MSNALLVTAACLALGALLTWGAWRAHLALSAYLVLIVGLNFWQVTAPHGGANAATFVGQEVTAMVLRYAVVVEALLRAFKPLPGARRVAAGVVLCACLATVALLAWGLSLAAGPRATFRALALANGGAGLTLLALRALTLHYYLPVHPLHRVTLTWFGAYLVLRSLLLGAATEWSGTLRVQAVTVSSVAWAGWALVLAWAAWTGQRWRRPHGIPS